MKINELTQKDWNRIIELYFTSKKYLYDLTSIENFVEQFLHRCDTCGEIISNFEMCEQCDNSYNLSDEYFDRNKEHFVYDLD